MRPLIFISHSSSDRILASELTVQLEDNFNVSVFASTRPESIPSGSDWQEEIIQRLDDAQILIMLITVPAINSVWVGFELGYFWRKTANKYIHALYHPSIQLPSPLNTLQGKNIVVHGEVEDLFKQIGAQLDQVPRLDFDFDRIVAIGDKLITIPPDRTIEKFEYFLETSKWSKGYINKNEVWVCTDDVIYQIVVNYERDAGHFSEAWTKLFPDSEGSYSHFVDLRVSGVTVLQLRFISVDGGRYFVPIPKIKSVTDGKQNFYWDRNSIEFKISNLVGEFYGVYPSIERFAEHTDIEIL